MEKSNKRPVSLLNSKPEEVQEQIDQFRLQASALVQNSNAVIVIGADPARPDEGIISGGIGNRDKLVEVIACALANDNAFRQMFREAYVYAVAAVQREQEQEQELEAEQEEQNEAVIVPFCVPKTTKLQ